MENLALVGLILLVVVAIVSFMTIRDRMNKKRIEKEIRLAGGEPIEISFKFVGYDRDNQHYNVQFTDSLGRKHEIRCKVNVWQNDIFWQRTPAEVMNDLPDVEERWGRLRVTPGNSKEQIIDDLVAENERLRDLLGHAEPLKGNLNHTE